MPEWVIPVGAVVAALVVVGIIIAVIVSHRHKAVKPSVEQPLELPVTAVVPAQEPVVQEIPLAHQPAIPAEQAHGMGWMKASDLVNEEKSEES